MKNNGLKPKMTPQGKVVKVTVPKLKPQSSDQPGKDEQGSKKPDLPDLPEPPFPKTIDITHLPAEKRPVLFESANLFMNAISVDSIDTLTEIVLANVPHVRDFVFYWPRYSPKRFQAVSSLDISFCPNVTDLGVRWIADYFPALKRLNATGCRQVTECAIRYLAASGKRLVSAKLDMTGVRYMPSTDIPSQKLSIKNCPLVLEEQASDPKDAKIATEWPKELTKVKVVIIKPAKMSDLFIGTEIAKPEAGTLVGDWSSLCCYRSGKFRLVECVEGPVAELLLSNNCVVVLPYFAIWDELQKEAASVEARFNFVATLTKNVKVIGLPIVSEELKKNKDISNVYELHARFDSILGEIHENTMKTVAKAKEMEPQQQFPTDETLATCRCLLMEDFQTIFEAINVGPWIDEHLPHDDIPKHTLILLKTAEKTMKTVFVGDLALPFVNVDHFAHNAHNARSSAEVYPCWPSLISVLTETGNLWLEPSFCSTVTGGKNILASFTNFVKFLDNLTKIKHSDAVTADITCLDLDTPLISLGEVKKLISPPRSERDLMLEKKLVIPVKVGNLSDTDCQRLLNLLESCGLAILGRKWLLFTPMLRPDPPIGLDHFIHDDSASISIEYQLVCHPSTVFLRVVAILSKFLQPTLIWSHGAFFYEASFLEVFVYFEDARSALTVKFMADKFASEKFDLVGGTLTKLKVGLQRSCSIVHSACCLALTPFAEKNVAGLGKTYGIDVLMPGEVPHNVKKMEPETYSRRFDSADGRCSQCLLDVNTLAAFRRLYNSWSLVTEPMIQQSTSGQSTSYALKIRDWEQTGSDSFQDAGFGSIITADLISADGLESVNVYPSNSSTDCVKLLFSEGRVADYFVTDTSTSSNRRKSAAEIRDKLTPRLNHGVQIEVVPSKDSSTLISIAVDGLTVFEHNFTGPCGKEFNLVLVPLAGGSIENFPIFVRSANRTEATDRAKVIRHAKVGMRLEAVDLIYPHLIAVARIDEISPEGKWLIKFDGWGSRFDYWAEPTAKHLFPCGFMEYVKRANLQDRLNANRGRTVNWQLQRPKESNYPQDPFPWLKYFLDLKMAASNQEDFVAEPAPLHCFATEHLLGFDTDPMASQYLKESRDEITLTAFCVNSKIKLESMVELDAISYRSVYYLPLPEITWSLCCWPSREKLTDSTRTYPHFLCTWPDFIHFVNESPTALQLPPVSINVIPALRLAIILKKILSQPHFLPDAFDQICSTIATDCPFPYPSFKVDASSTKPSDNVEKVLRQSLLPFLLDYLVMLYPLYPAESVDARDAFSNAPGVAGLMDAANSMAEGYLQQLHAEGHPNSRWASVTIPSGHAHSKCRLLNLQEAEPDFFLRHEDCPKLLCGQHAFHYTTFTKSLDADVKLDWQSSLSTLGNFHDKFITMCALNAGDVRGLSQPLNSLHPFLTEFVGFLSDGLVNSGLLASPWLRELYLARNELTDLPEALADYATTLVRLDLSRNNFTELPKVVYRLTALQYLRADYMNLQSLSEDIRNLKSLKTLSLKANCIAKLPVGLEMLTQLEVLDLSGLPLLPLGNASVHLEEAAAFFENNNFPKNAVDILIQWSDDEGIVGSMDKSLVERLNAVLFEKLPRLKISLDEPFPLQFDKFQSLSNLNLSNQPIINVPDKIGQVETLKRLDVSNCLNLKVIAHEIIACPIERLTMANCPELKTPPAEVRRRGLAEVIKYFKRLAEGSVNSKRTKLMFVGLGGAGKTSLVHMLKSDGQLPMFDITDGVDIETWQVECPDGTNIDYRMWDFAGQTVYYNTHQFFLSSRAVYLVLWNIRLGHEHAGLDFWLSSIASHAPNAPVLIVGTHADKVAQERSFLPEIDYRTRYENVCGFHYVSSYTGKGIPELRSEIIRVTLAQKHMGEAVPTAWMTFEGLLLDYEEEATSDDGSSGQTALVMMDKVKQIADIAGIYNADEVDQALQFLTDLGSIQYFRTDFLADRVIIDPQWIVDVMACVVSVRNTIIKEGQLRHEDIPQLWSEYPTEIHQWLLKLTEAFDLTFPLKKQPVSIVPCLLPENPPANLNWPSLEENPSHQQTRLTFSFKYLPSGLFNRVQVRLCQFSDAATMWRKGSLLRKNQQYALLTQPDSTSIYVKVQGPAPENIAFLILEVVDTLIFESFQGVQPDYLFACPGCVSARSPDPSMFERSRIRRAFELRIPFLQCWNYFHSVSKQELRQLFPAESSSEFETQFYRTVQEITNIKKSIKIDILVIGCSTDAMPVDMENSVSTPEVGRDIEKSFPDLKVVVIADPDASTDAVSYDHLNVMMRTARVIVFCLSEQFMASDRCQAAFFTGRETLRKPVLIAFIRDFDFTNHSALAFQLSDDIYVKAINRSKYKASDVAHKLQLKLDQVTSVDSSAEVGKKKRPEVFISYCWQNSIDAVNRGTKTAPSAIGVTDPRAMKKFLTEKGLECWLDIEQIGLGGLFRDIADGIRWSKVVVVCVSDEYVKSENCLREFHFATTSCRRPIILCPVGTGVDWQTSEVNLIVNQQATIINFQVDVKENYETLLKSVQSLLEAERNQDGADQGASGPTMLSKIGRRKTMTNLNSKGESEGQSGATQKSMVLHEIIELGQRKMLRQLAGYAQSAEPRPYPRLVLLDIAMDHIAQLINDGVQPSEIVELVKHEKEANKVEPSESQPKDENPKIGDGDDNNELEERTGLIIETEKEKVEFANAQEEDNPFAKLRWRVRYLCEHEGGWHPAEGQLLLQPTPAYPTVDARNLFRQSAGYFGPMMSFLRNTSVTFLDIFAPHSDEIRPICAEALAQIEKMSNPDEQKFDENYIKFLSHVVAMDSGNYCGGLRRRTLALGKVLWLCREHQNSVDYRPKNVAADEKAGGGSSQQPTDQADGQTNDHVPAVEAAPTQDVSERAKIGATNYLQVDRPKVSRACNIQ